MEKKRILRFKRFASLTIVVFMLMQSMICFASDDGESAYKNLGKCFVLGKESEASGTELINTNKAYTSTGGGFVSYSSLVSQECPQTGYIVEGNFELLTSSAKREFLNDMFSISESVEKANSSITSTTLSVWTKSLQTCRGVDTQLLSVLMSGTKPDFISALKVYRPFEQPVGMVLGVLSLVFFSLLAFSTVIDLFYIGNPIFNTFLTGDKKEKPGIVSSAAYKAYIQEAEGSGNNQGSSFKNAVIIYFKHRVITISALFVCFLYLVSGKIWDLLGDVLSLFGQRG